MRAEECIKGKIYKYGGLYIGRSEGGTQCKFYIASSHFEMKGTSWHYSTSAKEATEEEIKWFNACMEANKFVSFEEALKEEGAENYSIY